MEYFIRVTIAACLAVLVAAPAVAADYAQLADENLAEQATMIPELESARAVLEGKPQAEWADFEIQGYLYTALWTVYLGAAAYVYDHRVAPQNAEVLQNSGYVAQWPGNPFNDWLPMELKLPSDGFSSGDLCLQICPVDFYSGYQTLVPRCFELGVYGPDTAFAQFGDAAPMDENTWAVVPDGTVYMLGYYTMTHNDLMEVLASREN
jgi:hypothetical protein